MTLKRLFPEFFHSVNSTLYRPKEGGGWNYSVDHVYKREQLSFEAEANWTGDYNLWLTVTKDQSGRFSVAVSGKRFAV